MKTPIIHRVKFCPATIFLCFCAALLCALPNHASAQVRIINGRPVVDNPGGTPSGGDSSSRQDSSGKDSAGPWLPS
jgi:hypothetical protein